MNRQLLPSAELRELAELQSGVLTREQALGYGLNDESLRRILNQGWWRRLRAGVYQTSREPTSWRALAWAGVLLGGDRARLAGASAGFEMGLVREPPAQITVAIPQRRRVRPDPRWHFWRTVRLGTTHGTLPRSNAEDTVLDLIATDPDSMAGLVTDAVNQGLTTITRLRAAADLRPRVKRSAELSLLLSDVADGNMSPLELVYYRSVERGHGLPKGRRQVRQANGSVIDVEYDGGLIVELDGRRGHSGSGAFRDMHRDNYQAERGRLTLRFGWRDCTVNPCEVASLLTRQLHARGWLGVPVRCHRCAKTPAHVD